jgi:hypothetical protein
VTNVAFEGVYLGWDLDRQLAAPSDMLKFARNPNSLLTRALARLIAIVPAIHGAPVPGESDGLNLAVTIAADTKVSVVEGSVPVAPAEAFGESGRGDGLAAAAVVLPDAPELGLASTVRAGAAGRVANTCGSGRAHLPSSDA